MPPKRRITHGISFPDEEILAVAKQKAAAMRISFSTYVNQLIRKDLGQPGVLDWDKSRQEAAHRQKKGRFKEPFPLEHPSRRAK